MSSAGCWLAASPLAQLPRWFHPLCEHLDLELFRLALWLPRDPCRLPCLSQGDDEWCRRAWRDSLQLCGAGLLLGGILSTWGREKLGTQDEEVLVELRVAFPCTAVTSAPSPDPPQF